jgi:hypothetical protein
MFESRNDIDTKDETPIKSVSESRPLGYNTFEYEFGIRRNVFMSGMNQTLKSLLGRDVNEYIVYDEFNTLYACKQRQKQLLMNNC